MQRTSATIYMKCCKIVICDKKKTKKNNCECKYTVHKRYKSYKIKKVITS